MLKAVNWLQVAALLCVAATSGFFAYFAIKLTNILSSPDWCGKALQANKILPSQTFSGLTACTDLLKLQVGSLANALLIVIGTFALCLGVLVVIVIAGAKFAGKIFGADINVEKQDGSGSSQFGS